MRIDNIVVSGSLNQSLDLEYLDKKIPQVAFDIKRYPGAYLRFDGHSITIYSTGKYIIPGMKSFEDVDLTFEKMTELLTPYVDVSLSSKPVVRNIVCSSDCGRKLDLVKMLVVLQGKGCNVSYDPEIFPGLIYKADACTYNVFQSGRFIILGCTTLDDLHRSEQEFFSLVNVDI